MQLIDIQKLQFSDKAGAEKLMLAFLKANEDQSIETVELTPKPESLNSINGFITYDNGERVFFKTHVEENEQVSEYYNAKTLADAGYPVVSAKQIQHRPGKQIALYEILSLQTLFDLLKSDEDALLAGDSSRSSSNLEGQKTLEETVFHIYEKTLRTVTAEEDSKAPIHQLFSHRLQEDGRLGLFYKGNSIIFPKESGPNEEEFSFERLAGLQWTINGVTYSDSLDSIIKRSQQLLNPASGSRGAEGGSAQACPAIVGHGDAHNGNIFVDPSTASLMMFDPAFAGLHNPLLDLIKPLFHNIFARWMYFPEQVRTEFEISYKVDLANKKINVEHSFFPSAIRIKHLELKKKLLFDPTIALLRDRQLLRPDYVQYIRSALFCCPFLTVNLFAKYVANGTLSERYTFPIKLLGLVQAVLLGSLSHEGKDQYTEILDDVLATSSSSSSSSSNEKRK